MFIVAFIAHLYNHEVLHKIVLQDSFCAIVKDTIGSLYINIQILTVPKQCLVWKGHRGIRKHSAT